MLKNLSDHSLEENRTRKAFLAHMRHELGNPINAIIGYSEMLLEDFEEQNQEAFVADLKKIHTAGKQLLSLVNDILDSKKIEMEKGLDLENLKGSMHHVLRTPTTAVIGFAEMLMEDAEGTGQQDFISDLKKIHTAGNNLLSLINYIMNLSRIQAGTTSINLDSSDVSTQIQDVVSTVSPLIEDKVDTSNDEYGVVLVVDDNETNRDLLSHRLERQGYTTAVAENGRKALEMIKTQKFDLVLLDIMMPEINGYQVLQQLKADDSLRQIPVIIISALDELDSIIRCIEMGAEDYLTKPFDPVLLKARIGACMEKTRLRDREMSHLRKIEEEKKRNDELLHVILPHEIVEELKANGKVKPQYYENVAVLFCDIVGFTSYCEKHEPAEIVQNLQALVKVYEDLAYHTYGIEKIKTIGDSFMATAGLLKPLDNPVLNCVKYGLEMISVARGLPSGWRVRVGIHVGPVIAGIVGGRRYLFDLWGDTVNTAARVESNGIADAVNVSRAALKLISELCRYEIIGHVHLKGKGKVEIFRIDELTTMV